MKPSKPLVTSVSSHSIVACCDHIRTMRISLPVSGSTLGGLVPSCLAHIWERHLRGVLMSLPAVTATLIAFAMLPPAGAEEKTGEVGRERRRCLSYRQQRRMASRPHETALCEEKSCRKRPVEHSIVDRPVEPGRLPPRVCSRVRAKKFDRGLVMVETHWERTTETRPCYSTRTGQTHRERERLKSGDEHEEEARDRYCN